MINLGEGSLSGRAIQLVLMLTVLSLAPGILTTITSFTCIVVALSLLRTGIGARGVPPNPVPDQPGVVPLLLRHGADLHKAWSAGVQPYQEGRISRAAPQPGDVEHLRRRLRSVGNSLPDALRASIIPSRCGSTASPAR